MKRISKHAIKYWRIKSSLYLLIPIILILGLFILKYFAPVDVDLPINVAIAVVLFLTLIYIIYSIIVKPKLMYKYFRYQIIDETLIVERGIFTRSRHVAPLFRIQNIDMTEGPIMRKMGLSGISLATASETLYIPELQKEDAVALRKDIRSIINARRSVNV